MSVDVVDLRAFYATPLGKAAEASLMRAVSSCVEAEPKGVVIGLGYVVPLLDLLGASGAIAFMPARQGALQWPDGASSKTALVDEDELPLANASVDLIIMLHVLENVAVPLETL